jgi:hypothetical protein
VLFFAIIVDMICGQSLRLLKWVTSQSRQLLWFPRRNLVSWFAHPVSILIWLAQHFVKTAARHWLRRNRLLSRLLRLLRQLHRLPRLRFQPSRKPRLQRLLSRLPSLLRLSRHPVL